MVTQPALDPVVYKDFYHCNIGRWWALVEVCTPRMQNFNLLMRFFQAAVRSNLEMQTQKEVLSGQVETKFSI